MRLTKNERYRAGKWMGVCLIGIALAIIVHAQTFSTTTVQGTVYLANGTPGAGTLQLSWPAFTTANNQAVAAGRTTVPIGTDGFVSLNLAPNLGSMPGGLYYTAVYYMSDGTTSTEYWVVPTAAQTTIAQVRAQVMPAAQAVHAVNKAYVDQAIQSLSQSYLAPSGGSLSGPLFLNGDPTQALQAADKHYVDSQFNMAVPMTGANMTGPLTSVKLGAAYQADQFIGADFGAMLQACLAALSPVNGGTCDARNFTGNQSMASNLTISTANTTVMLPCATISTASQVIVTAGTRNVALRGCALRGASNASGSQGGTVFLYSGTGAMIQVGDPTYAADTMGFHMDNAVINTTASTHSTAQALVAYRTQEMDLESLYLLGNSNQTGMTLDGTGNYTGGTYYDNAFNGFETAVNAIGHQVSNSATTDWLNASTFVRLHIDCPTSSGTPITGTYGINLQQGDGNTFTGGDVEGCDTALHLGPNAQNNTIVGLRNENSNSQVVADAGSSYNNWITGGTMFTGKLADNGTRNSFLDTFHRSFNGVNGDWYGSQLDATVTNHYRIGIGAGNERGMLDRYQTDSGYRWTTGLSDATAGEQFYQVLDELNNVYRLSIGQYNTGQPSSNNQTVINAAGTGAVVLNGSNNSGTGGVVIGSGGAAEATVATINNSGNAQFNGTLQVGSSSTFSGSTTVRNQADAEIDSFLWAGATTNQKESLTYKDYTGSSQWYMVKDASNNWALNSATGGLDSFKAYQSTNSGDTYINASNPSGIVRVNYENGAGTGFSIYGGNSGTLYAGFTGTTSIKFPGLAAGTGHNCLQIDDSGYITNTGLACGTGSGSGTVNSGASGQIAYYSGSGTALSGMSAVPVIAGGTGATSAAEALTSLGAASLASAATQTFAGPINFGSPSATSTTVSNLLGTNFLSLTNQSGSTPQAQFTNSTMAATGQTLLFVPPQVPGGTSTAYPSATAPLNSFLRVFDTRGTNCMDSGGTFSGNGNNNDALCIYAVETKSDASQPNSYGADFSLGYNSIAGGTYNYNGSSGFKSNRFTLMVNGTHSTVAQKWGVMTNITSYTNGETIPLGVQLTEYGGWESSGQEPSEGLRIEEDQGGASDGSGGVWKATAGTISGTTVPFTATSNANTLGEARFIRDLNHKYTGSYTAVSCAGTAPATCTVTGSGFSALPGYATNPHTTWNDSGNLSGNILTNNAVFCLPLQNGSTHDVCVPITTVSSDTSLTVNLAVSGPSSNAGWYWATSGSYAIYGSAVPVAVNVAAGTLTANDVRGIGSGDTLDQIIAYNPKFMGIAIVQNQSTGMIGPTGIQVLNNASPSAIGGSQGFDAAGLYSCAYCLDSAYSGVATHGLYASSGGLPSSGIVDWAGGYTSLPASPYNLVGPLLQWQGGFSPPFLAVGGNSTSNALNINPSTGEVSHGTYPQSGWRWYDYYNSATESGYNLALGSAPNNGVLVWMISKSGVPYVFLAGQGSGVQFAFNNGTPANFYSGNQTGLTASINSTTGQGTFASLALTAYQTGSIGGSALTAGTCASGTVSIANATTSTAVIATPITYPGDAFDWKAYVSSAGTVTVKVCTNLAAGGTPTASVYNVRVIQ